MTRQDYIAHLDHLRKGVVDLMEYDAKKKEADGDLANPTILETDRAEKTQKMFENLVTRLYEDAGVSEKVKQEKLMNGEEADLLVTDPPYNVNYEGGTDEKLTIENDNMDSESFQEFLFSAFTNANEHMRPGAGFYVWYASREVVNFVTALARAELEVRQELIWNKNSLVLGRQDYQWKHEPCLYGWKGGAGHFFIDDRSLTTVLDFNKPTVNREHPTMKPLDLIGFQVRNSTKQGEKVLDLFGGSGSTLIACEQLGRKCYTMEFDPRYVDVIIERWENHTGKKAVLLDD